MRRLCYRRPSGPTSNSEAYTIAESQTLLRPSELRDLVVEAIADRRGRDVVVLEVAALTDVTDYMILVTGTSRRHVRALVDAVHEAVKRRSAQVLGIEGADIGEWVLIDLADVVVHVMQTQTRAFYDLERLWSDLASPVAEI